jgi:hypothetical protein
MKPVNLLNSLLKTKSVRKTLLKKLNYPQRKIIPIDSYSPIHGLELRSDERDS